MEAQVTVDTLIASATLLAVAVLLLSSFYGLYITAEESVRRGHLKYLSRVIEDRMEVCGVVDGAKVYAPYEVNVFCDRAELCWREVCVPVRCDGGGTGKTFVVRDCRLLPVE